MCGITGFLNESRGGSDAELRAIVTGMARTLGHRGPDDAGVWLAADGSVALGHRRLAVVDLSPCGHQPMVSADERFILVYNGEVYNHPALRRELEQQGHVFRGHSDTEVLLSAVQYWGVRKAVERAIGMFAFALWDSVERQLTLVRDRLGIKPLYYGWAGSTFLFGSELKALCVHPAFRPEVDRDVLALFLKHNWIPAPYSIYRGIYKLPAGSLLTVSPGGGREPSRMFRYWDLKPIAETGASHPFSGSDEQAVDALESLLRDAVRQRMQADVPLGALLSGGVDSSTVVALAQAQSQSPIRTFTIGFEQQEYDESQFARNVARHLGTEHVEMFVTAAAARDVIPRLAEMFDEPFADSSQIPTFVVCQLARRHVTVCLSGDGGDELFGGYDHYEIMQQRWRRLCGWPLGVRRAGAAVLRTAALAPLGRIRQRLRNRARLLLPRDPAAMYCYLQTQWKQPEELVIGGRCPATHFSQPNQWARLPGFVEQMMYVDAVCYLPDDILVKVDRASMAASLEVRVPLLDHRVVEFTWSLSPQQRYRPGQPKWMLRKVLSRYLPGELIERPKAGFAVPINSWLRGPLREWAEDLLSPQRLAAQGYLHSTPVREKWTEHLAGKHDWQYHLWDVLMFQSWLDTAMA